MSAKNPIDTREQRQHELLALELYNSPELRRVREHVHDYWLQLANPSLAMRSCFEWAFEEVMFGAVVWALNQDPLYPKVITITRLAHTTLGQAIPGSRWGIDNPDSVYRVIPISSGERYVIRGRVHRQRLAQNTFTLWDKDMRTVGLMSGKDLVLDDQGYFDITVDRDPAGERPNHIQAEDSAHEFYIRDVVADWARDRVNELTIERLGAAPTRAPQSRDELIELAGRYMEKWAVNTHRWNDQALHKPVNEFSYVIDREDDGAQVGQVYIMGCFKLPDAEHAIVLDVDLGGAAYFIAPITNVWGTSNVITDRLGCLNNQQALANDDGTYTFVLSVTDPGARNWLDPSDMPEGILTLRWAEFAGGRPGATLGVKSELVPLADLKVAQAQEISPGQRAQQGEARAASYAWRLQENTA